MNKKIILYTIVGILILGLLLITFFPGIMNTQKSSGNSIEDQCKPGIGYTEESWREHMSHHPNIYKDCLS